MPASKGPSWCYCSIMLQVFRVHLRCINVLPDFSPKFLAIIHSRANGILPSCSCFDYTNALAVRFPSFWIRIGTLVGVINHLLKRNHLILATTGPIVPSGRLQKWNKNYDILILAVIASSKLDWSYHFITGIVTSSRRFGKSTNLKISSFSYVYLDFMFWSIGLKRINRSSSLVTSLVMCFKLLITWVALILILYMSVEKLQDLVVGYMGVPKYSGLSMTQHPQYITVR